MTAVQVYSNANNYFSIFIFIGSFIIISVISVEVYLYINDYIENINNKINNIHKMLISQTDIIQKNKEDILTLKDNFTLLTTKINSLQELSDKFREFEKNIEVVKKDLNDISKHSHKNMDKIFELTDTTNNKILEITGKLSCNDKDIYSIVRTLEKVETIIPNYVLIGLKQGPSSSIPIFVPNDFTFTETNIINYGLNDEIHFIVNNFKYIQNLKEIVLANFQNSKIHFTKKLFSTYNGNNKEEYNENRIISICAENFNNVVGWPSRPNPNYILNIQDVDTRNYYKKGLRTLRSELLKMDIKLILNEDIEEFIR
jgi:hypothetical protein